MIQRVSISEFLSQSPGHLIVDVRSPLEYQKGHIPGAQNIALFSDDERAVIGTLYKQAGKQEAILQGLQLVGPKLFTFVQAAQSLTDKKSVFIYCWRGGMRSGSFAWLLNLYGFDVFVLEGGYKSYRNFTLEVFSRLLHLIVVSGKTGTGKTKLLHEYHSKGKQVIDLEGLACHKGSVFGGIGQQAPTQEQFENNLASVIASFDSAQPIWIEDESRHIGKIMIPVGLWEQKCNAPLQFVEKTKEERITLLMDEYQHCSNEDLQLAVLNLQKHLGSQRCQQAQQLLQENNRMEFCGMLLDHYDRAYEFSFAKRNQSPIVDGRAK